MADHRRRFDPLDATRGQRQRTPERRRDGERMHRRTDIVHKARQRERGRTGAAANRLLRLEHDDFAARLREHNSRAQTVRPRTDDDGINLRHGGR